MYIAQQQNKTPVSKKNKTKNKKTRDHRGEGRLS